jgi:hypothetical protein
VIASSCSAKNVTEAVSNLHGGGNLESLEALDCFHISLLTGFIVERLTQPVHRPIQRLLEVDERVFSPDPLLVSPHGWRSHPAAPGC